MLKRIGFGLVISAALVSAAAAQDSEADVYSDLFTHPRDSHYLPGKAPSSARLVEETEVETHLGERGMRYEYSNGRSRVTREVWRDSSGTPQSRIRFGVTF